MGWDLAEGLILDESMMNGKAKDRCVGLVGEEMWE